ncbi:MAG: hypothetical protein JW828_00580 [Sedimentisphaerales bacterium]|nr:hypothetical protein [Sedimentisphaerales bacterium]
MRMVLCKSVVMGSAILIACLFLPGLAYSEQGQILWQIGTDDNNTAEFALGPAGHGEYSQKFGPGSLFVVGKSDPKEDWAYIQPGPEDAWAGNKSHTFTILFGLEAAPKDGICTLTIDYVDTHSAVPPKVEIRINDTTFEQQTPRGAGDDSAHGQVEKGREHILTVEFPITALRQGNNVVTLTSRTGSWVLYDYLKLETPAGLKLIIEAGDITRLIEVRTEPALVDGRDGKLYQPIQARLQRIGAPVDCELRIEGKATGAKLESGFNEVTALLPMVRSEKEVTVEVRLGNETLSSKQIAVKPVRKWTIYLLHHTHLDIGYTHVQTEVERMQHGYLDQAVELGAKTADYPPEAKFKWLPEGLWAVDSYLKTASPEKRQAFLEAVRNETICLDGLYGNQLTALCNGEELLELVGCARRFSKDNGIRIDSAMITDVPGYTWGLVPILAQSGIKYLSIGPNFGHRIGYTLSTWGDKPFYWVGPSGKEKVLCWMAGMGYSWFHTGLNYTALQQKLQPERFFDYLRRLEAAEYQYDMVQIRYNIGSDNGPPDPHLPDWVRSWNAKYAYPKMIIASPSQMFRAFEARYRSEVPEVRGDFTPYWEDGAASSARETVRNRASARRLVQAQALFSLLRPGDYPAERFHDAWREILLYDEHTWGSWNSISDPECDFTKQQWAIKKAFADEGARQSRTLIRQALAGAARGKVSRITVVNTLSWPRTAVVVLPSRYELAGTTVQDEAGKVLLSQKLSDGGMAFLAKNVPPLGSCVYTIGSGDPGEASKLVIRDNALSNGRITVKINPDTGAIAGLHHNEIDVDFAANGDDIGLNDFFYVAGRDPKDPKRNGKPQIHVKEVGPLVASLRVESDAPGCESLVREVTVFEGLDHVAVRDTLDRKNVYDQEGLHFAYDFNVPDGVVRMEAPWAVVRPERDQMDGACKNYFTVQQWVDVSNADYGITWATPDAPLIEVGSITNDPRSSVGWIKKLEPTTRLYSYVMNNYWETNYKASQPGVTTFEYALLPHGKYDQAAATRFGAERSNPMIVIPVTEQTGGLDSLFTLSISDVIVSTVKPADTGTALIVRLYNPTPSHQRVSLEPNRCKPREIWLSNPFEEKVLLISGPIDFAPYEFITLRLEAPLRELAWR